MRCILQNVSVHSAGPKKYEPIFKFFITNKNISCHPSLFYENKFITGFQDHKVSAYQKSFIF